MMKTACLFFTAIMVLGFGASAEPAYARECRLAGGQQWSVSVQARFDTPLCVFGKAAVGAPELAHYKWGHGLARSLRVFLNSPARRSTRGLCDVVGAAYVTASDSNGSTWELCRFPDDSVIELDTLAGGARDPDNARLLRALK